MTFIFHSTSSHILPLDVVTYTRRRPPNACSCQGTAVGSSRFTVAAFKVALARHLNDLALDPLLPQPVYAIWCHCPCGRLDNIIKFGKHYIVQSTIS